MMSRERLQHTGVTAFLLLMTVYLGANALISLTVVRSTRGWYAEWKDGHGQVARVIEGGAAASVLAPGDEIVAVNGKHLRIVRDVARLDRAEPGTSYSLTIRRDGQEREVALQTEPAPASGVALNRLVFFLIGPLFLVFAGIIYVFKSDTKQAVLLALLFGSFMPGTLFTQHDVLPLGARFVVLLGDIASNLMFPFFFHFFLVFPEPSPLLRRFPRLERLLYLPWALVTLPVTLALFVLINFAPMFFQENQQALQTLQIVVIVIGSLYVFAGLGSLLVNYRQANRQSRRRLRVVVAGSLAGLLPAFVVTMYAVTIGFSERQETLEKWLFGVSVAMLLLFPLSFAYAIMRHQVIPVRLMIRRGIRYVFVRRGSVVVETVAVGVALVFFLDTFFRYFAMQNRFTVGVVSGVLAVGVWNLTSFVHHRWVAPAIDTRFFRRAYDPQRLIAEVGEALRGTTDLHRMQSIVGAALQEALQTENITVLLLDQATDEYRSDLTARYSEHEHAAFEAHTTARLPARGFIVERLHRTSEPLDVDLTDDAAWTAALLRLAERDTQAHAEIEAVRRMDAVLLVPVRSAHDLLGVISLGARLGDLPFGDEDRRLLAALALQLAYAIENSELVRRQVAEEGLRREIEMATEVQQRLFPNCAPTMRGLDLCGVCFPARGVGGDYYDFLRLDEHEVGIAVADVAGKGIAAALLMSTVQASLRSYAPIAVSAEAEVTDLVHSMNSLLYEATAANSYASFFYARFDERTRRLTYTNAGHNPPLLIRAGDANNRALTATHAHTSTTARNSTAVLESPLTTEATREADAVRLLTTGGPVIGIFERCDYEQETLTLETGDVLIAYTDGVTEALNSAGQEYGEDHLQREAEACAKQTAQEISRCLVAKVKEWCGDTPQHDDITLVVMKVK